MADSAQPPAAVRVRDLWKRFGAQPAVAGIDLDLPAGRFVGLVGPNGAGKTTTLSMITGLLRPDHGKVAIGGADVWRDPVAVKARIGVLPEGLRLFERLSGRELLAYTGRLRGIPGPETDRRAGELLDVLDLASAGNKLVVDYSTGMRKKIGLAAALLHNPEVLFLDEPFEGVDPVSAQVIRNVLERYTGSGATVVFSSHVMELVESLCDWVAVMSAGNVVAQGPLAEVRGGAPTLQDAFLALVGAADRATGPRLEWLDGRAAHPDGGSGSRADGPGARRSDGASGGWADGASGSPSASGGRPDGACGHLPVSAFGSLEDGGSGGPAVHAAGSSPDGTSGSRADGGSGGRRVSGSGSRADGASGSPNASGSRPDGACGGPAVGRRGGGVGSVTGGEAEEPADGGTRDR